MNIALKNFENFFGDLDGNHMHTHFEKRLN